MMPYRICKTFEIENGHMLSKHPDLCKFPHGHSRKVEIVLEADSLDGNEMVCDFKAVTESLNEHLKTLDHAICVNTQDPNFKQLKTAYGDRVVAFEALDPTTEVIAKAIFDFAKSRLVAYGCKPSAKYPIRPNIRLVKIRLWETSSSWAEYFEASGTPPRE
ncbi:MAG TPA: 6-carboxytetrahydropterin synthase [Verrucomicrobiae bacterium]|jgi:6-pyruvoyltetrahydropterin/6-carboxytetrahydropterin synthase